MNALARVLIPLEMLRFFRLLEQFLTTSWLHVYSWIYQTKKAWPNRIQTLGTILMCCGTFWTYVGFIPIAVLLQIETDYHTNHSIAPEWISEIGVSIYISIAIAMVLTAIGFIIFILPGIIETVYNKVKANK